MSIFTLGATWINALLNTIWLSICKVIFIFINWLYQVFETVANVNLFSEEVFSDITSRIYIVMGIAMLFIFAYNLVLMIINPDDKKSTGSTTKLVKETIISLIVIVLLPTIFNYMYVFQGHVLSTNIIGQIIMGGIGSTSGDDSNCDPDDYECSCDFSQFEEIKKYGTGQDKNIFAEGFTEGNKDVYSNLVDACKSYKNDLTDSQRGAYSIAPTIFSAFYRPATYDMLDCEEYLKTGSSTLIDTDQKKQVCANFFYDIKMSKYTGNINAFVSDSYLNLTMSTDEGLIEFDWLFAIVAGGLAVWMFLCYAMEIGVRVAKLGVLQIISPIAVMMRVVPSKGGGQNQMFTKWFDELKNTYLDVFIRLVIIYFSLFAISLVPDVIATLFSSVYSGESNWFLQTLSLVIVILGILKFAQEAPELIKTFFGSSGKFALRSPGKQLADNKLGGAALGMAGTGLASLAGNVWNAGNRIKNAEGLKNKAKALGRGALSTVGGTFGGAFRGMTHGYGAKGFKDLGKKIAEAKEATDAAQNAGFGQRWKHRANRVATGLEDFGQFITGTGASNIIGNAANAIMIDVDNMESDFSNAEIAGIKSGRDEIMKKLNADQEFDYNGSHYRKKDGNTWTDGTNDIKTSDLRKNIVDDYKNRLAMSYAANELKDGIIDGFKRANEGMLKDLRDALPKFGNEFSDSLFTKLNGLKDVNNESINLDVHSIDELEKRMGSMINKAAELSKSNDENMVRQGKEILASVYKINDEIKSAAKGKKIENDQALKAQAANKDKK